MLPLLSHRITSPGRATGDDHRGARVGANLIAPFRVGGNQVHEASLHTY